VAGGEGLVCLCGWELVFVGYLGSITCNLWVRYSVGAVEMESREDEGILEAVVI